MLPVFRLPQVGSGSQFLNRMPREALGDEEAQRMHEDEEDEALAASQLGLTEEELAEFDEEVAEKTNRRSSLARRGSATSIGAPDAAMADLDAGNSLPTLSKPSLADASFRSTFSVDKFGGRSTPRCLQPRNDATSDDLRRELGTSISLIQTLTEQVREDIAEVHRTCPVHNIKASMYMQRWGLEKFEQIFKRIELMREGAALRKWRHAVDEIIKFEKKEKYFKLRAAKKCDRFVHRMQNRELHWAFSIWEEGIREMKRRERRALEEESAVMIQCCARCYIARTRVAAIKAQIQSDRENAAASKIQMIYRGRTTRRHVALLLEQITMNRAALMVQRAWRGRAAREAYNKMREAQAMNKAVLMVQCAWRNRHARALMRTIRADRKKSDAATVLQKYFRRRLASKKVATMRVEAFEGSMATRIQARFRGREGRRLAKAKLLKAQERSRIENAAAVKIQSQYRSHRGRITFMLKIQKHRFAMAKENAAATKLQAIYRGRLGRRRVKDMSGANKDELIALAREYTEMWDEDYQAYFYYNAERDEALWEPPRQGYTKSDSKLVLRTGEVIPDPELDPAANAQHCVECEDELAARYCADCDDAYCASCYDNTHSAGKRVFHRWEPIGPTRCMECEQEVATRWCVDCDDPYCESCYKVIHAKGKKKRHKWNPIGQEEEQDEQAAAGAEAYGETGESAVDAFIADAQADQAEWEEFYDDDAGCSYWYNHTTGASTYEDPYNPVSTPAGGGYAEPEAYGSDGYGAVSAYEGTDEEYGAAGAEWQEYFDEDSGLPYWYSVVTGETAWEDPNGGGAGAGAGAQDYGGAEGYGSEEYAGAEGYGSSAAEQWEEY